jgi:Flp pilus assembly protein TadG
MSRVRAFIADTHGGGAAEFALVVPALLLFLFGIIDVARLMWTYNLAEKATQSGVRFAVVTDVIPTELNDDFALTYSLVGGEPVPTSTFASTTCTNVGCSGNWGYNGTAFTAVVTRMRRIYGPIAASNVRIRYDNVGLGFAGDPNGPDVAALVTVELQNLTFQPIALIVFNTSLALPTIQASMTMEDGSGTESN